MYSVIVTIIAILVILFDVGYYLRAFFLVFFGRIFQRKYTIDETITVYSICTTRDVDFFFNHMNNARYLRVLDSCRMHFYDRNGFHAKVVENNAAILMGATTVRYRRPLSIFNPYKIETKILCWDDKTIFLEHKFITLTDNFVRAIVLCRTHIVGLDVPKAISELPGAQRMKNYSEEVDQWQQSMETVSAKLRNQDYGVDKD